MDCNGLCVWLLLFLHDDKTCICYMIHRCSHWRHQVPLKIGTMFCFGEISLLAWVHVHASNMHIVKFKTNIAFIHGYGTTILPLMFSWLSNYRTCHGLKTVFAWCCFLKQRIDENRLVFQVQKNSYQPKGKFGNFAAKTSQSFKFQTLQHKCCKNQNLNFSISDNQKFKKSKIQDRFFYISTWLTT